MWRLSLSPATEMEQLGTLGELQQHLCRGRGWDDDKEKILPGGSQHGGDLSLFTSRGGQHGNYGLLPEVPGWKEHLVSQRGLDGCDIRGLGPVERLRPLLSPKQWVQGWCPVPRERLHRRRMWIVGRECAEKVPSLQRCTTVPRGQVSCWVGGSREGGRQVLWLPP